MADTAAPRRAVRTHTFLLSVAFAVFWVPVILFAGIADEVAEHEPLPGDTVVLGALHAAHSSVLNNVFLLFTSLGEPLVVAGAGFIVLTVLLARHRFRMAALLLAGVGGATLANVILKFVFARTRPTEFAAIVTETSYSFPSGHAMVSSAFAVVVILLAWHTRARYATFVAGTLATLLIGISRVYLGVHYPSDVLAGWSVGTVWVLIAGSVLIGRPFALGRRLSALVRHG